MHQSGRPGSPRHIPVLRALACRVLVLLVGWSVAVLCPGPLGSTAAHASNPAIADLQGQFRPSAPFDSRATSPRGFSGATLLGRVADAERSSVLDRDSAVLGDRGRSLAEFARKVSYAGVLLLTADRLVRSMDSVMENMQLRCEDGTCLRLEVSPQSKGMEMMLRISRPIGF